MSGLYGFEMGMERIAVTVSGDNALNFAFQSLLNESDTLAILTSGYPNLLGIPTMQGARLTTHPLGVRKGKWLLDAEVFFGCSLRSKSGASQFSVQPDRLHVDRR